MISLLARKCPAMFRELCVCPKDLKMLILMLHQEHTNLCLCGRLHNEGFFINTYIDKNTSKSWCSLLHYKQYLISDPNSWKPEILHMKNLKKEMASSSVWKACHKKMCLDCKNKRKWKMDNFVHISSNWEVWDEYGVLNMEKRYWLRWFLFDNVTLSTNFA